MSPSMVQQRKVPQLQPYQVVNAPGGSFHVYPGGRRVFVPHMAAQPKSAAAALSPVAMSPVKVPPTNVNATPATHKPATAANPYAPDSTYFADVAQRRFQGGQQQAALDQQSAYGQIDLHEALRRMGERQPKDLKAAREQANRQGLLYSGHLGQQEGEINTAYARQEGDLRQSSDRAEAARAAARRAIEAGYSVDDAAALAASIDRQVARDTAAADAGALPTPKKKRPKVKKVNKSAIR